MFQKNTSPKIIKSAQWLVVSALVAVGLFFLLNWIFPLPDKIEYSVLITDCKGEVINAYLTQHQKWRMKTELNEISPLLRKTIIAKEDRFFYYHPGINFIAIVKAFFKNTIRLKTTSGASTITMQVARQLEHRKRNVWSKLIETFRAFQLEWKYSKDEILQLYLNLVPYGSNIEGVKSASVLYFKKNPDHLSLAEITALSIIPNRPSSLVIGKNNAFIQQERNKWLQRFGQQKIFSNKEIEVAISEPLNAERGSVPHFIPHLAEKLKANADNIIRTNIAMNTQLKAEKMVHDYVQNLQLKNITNASIIIINNHTHQVITYIGSADFNDKKNDGQVNGAAAIRQPGSTLKPLLYGLCMDEGLLTPKTVVSDVSINYAGYAPENYDKSFNGFVTIEYALEHSLNIPAVKSLHELGMEKMLNKLENANFKQIKKDRKKLGLSMILGGCGATLEELTGLFSSFANDGIFIAPQFTQADTLPRKALLMSPTASFMITDILSRINRPDFPINWQATEHLPKIAWKTGTSYGRRDGWSIGYNKNFTIGIWVGNFSGEGNMEISGANVATPLLFKLFNTIDYDSNSDWFTPPKNCESRKVCSETGLLPAENCKNLVMDYFIPLVSSNKICDNQKEIFVSADEKISFCKACLPESGYKKKWLKIFDADMQAWMDDNKINYDKIPPHNPSCEKVFKEGTPKIIFPVNGREYLISKKNPEPLQLSCKAATDVLRVYWYINDKIFKSGGTKEKIFFMPEEGNIKISCADDKGRNKNIVIKVKFVNL